jgi:HEAT repeat protein
MVGIGAVAAAAAMLLAARPWRPAVEGATPEDRIRSVCRAADREGVRAAGALADAASNDPSPAVRQAALVALGRLAPPQCRDCVEKATRDGAPEVRAAAAAALGAYPDEAAADRLGDLARKDPEAEVRRGAATGLARHRSPKALVWLMEAGEREPSAEVLAHMVAKIFERLGMRYIGAQQAPDDAKANLLSVIEGLKDNGAVRKAFEQCGRRLEFNPRYYVPPLGEPDPRQPGQR